MLKFSFQQRVFTGFGVTLFFVFALAIVSNRSIKTLQDNASWVTHSEVVLAKANHILELLTNAEAGERGYIITNMPAYMQPYRQSINLVNPEIKELREFVADDPAQVTRVDTLARFASIKLAEMQKIIAALDTKGFDAAKAIMLSNPDKLNLDRISKSIDDIKTAENNLLDQRRGKSASSVFGTWIVILLGSVIILANVLVLLFYIIGTFKRQKLTEEQFRLSNAELDKMSKDSEEQNWVLEGAVIVDVAMRGAQTLDVRSLSLITEVSKYVKADLAAIYIADPTGHLLHVEATYAFPKESTKSILQAEVGLIGQAVVQKKGLIFYDIPKNYIKVSSGLGETLPKTIFIQPIFIQDQLVAVIELAFVNDFTLNTDRLFEKVAYSIGISVQAAQARVAMQNLIQQTQQQAEELESQHEELRTTNDELIQKTQALQSSEEELRVQQEELKQMNAELEEKADMLEEQNRVVEHAREAVTLKAQELEKTSKYKSEFLANMSHELRTPLNSILILARILKENKTVNLSDEQIKYASVIHNAGNDLLNLINDILDLAKIESGKVDLSIEEVTINEIKLDLELLFREVFNNKKIKYAFSVATDVPASIVSDRLRIEQILKNLLSNASKFTPENGAVSVDVRMADPGREFLSENLAASGGKNVVAFTVTDTGIGIEPDKQQVIFEAFQQADGSTSRKFGGTGLGLSISRELSNILGGEMGVTSKPGEGSSFTLYLPLLYNKEPIATDQPKPPISQVSTKKAKSELIGEIKLNENGENTILIVEDDVNFAELLKDFALERGFKPILAYQGDTGLEMALEHLPNAIVLDIMLPVMDGWAVLKKLKDNPKTKDIPVHLMSAGDERSAKARQEGAIGFMKKPIDKEKLDEVFDLLIHPGQFKLNKVLIIEDQEIQSEDLRKKLVKNNVAVWQAFDGAQATDILKKEQNFDCIILDLNLPDISGLDLLDKIKAEGNLSDIPVVINTAMELDQKSMARITKHTHAMVLKNIKSNDRLMDEVNLFMNKVKKDGEKPPSYRLKSDEPVKNSAIAEKALRNKSVLIVDDDMRNIFALTSALQAYALNIEIAVNGVEALKKLDENPKTDIVLMDIMMPEMDGYETMREIRKQNRFSKIRIIALTAKAMKNDKEKCITAGANDYISKPIDIDKLLSLMRVWLS